MIRRTSIEIYRRIKEEGLLSQLRFEVYDVLYRYGPLTAGEAWSWYFSRRQRSSISARMSELEERGVVYQHEERVCGLTGNKAIAWATTDRLPVDPPKKEAKKPCPHCQGTGYYQEPQPAKTFERPAPTWKESLFD